MSNINPDYWLKEIKRLENALAAAKWMWRKENSKRIAELRHKHVK